MSNDSIETYKYLNKNNVPLDNEDTINIISYLSK